MQRLDDPSSGIRILAAAVIPKLKPKFLKKEEGGNDDKSKAKFELDVWLAFVKNCLDLMFLHFDGPEKRLKDVIKGN